MTSRDTTSGNLAIILQSIIWGLFPVITSLSFGHATPLASLFFGTFFATIFFAILLTLRKKWPEIMIKSAWPDMVKVSFFIGVLYYVLYFIGLKHTSPGNAALIALTETFFSYLFFNVWKKELLSARTIIGSMLMLLGAALVLLPRTGGFRLGDILVMAAASAAPFGNYFQRAARTKISSETMMFLRGIITMPIILIIWLLSDQTISMSDFRASVPLFLINGILVLGISKILWIEGIHRISVTKANALTSIAPLCTLVFSAIFMGQVPTYEQIFAFFPLTIGLFLLTQKG